MNFKLIIGIGNNLFKYNNTRHNIGIWFIKILSKKFHKKLKYNININCLISEIFLKNNKIILLVPNSFINLSGIYIKKAIDYFNITNISNILVVHDDIRFNIGNYNIKYKCNSYNHNGIKSIVNNIKCNKFYRLRIGINNNNINNISNFVLSNPNNLEKEKIITSIYNSIDYIINNTFLY